jgi:hypothetical protein
VTEARVFVFSAGKKTIEKRHPFVSPKYVGKSFVVELPERRVTDGDGRPVADESFERMAAAGIFAEQRESATDTLRGLDDEKMKALGKRGSTMTVSFAGVHETAGERSAHFLYEAKTNDKRGSRCTYAYRVRDGRMTSKVCVGTDETEGGVPSFSNTQTYRYESKASP